MTLMTESTRTRGFRRALIAGAFGAATLGVAAVPALADTLGYYYDGPPVTVVTPAPPVTTTTYTYTPTYTYPAYTYPAPAYVYEPAPRPGFYIDTPILNFGIGFH
jgi:hypothetical protein